MSCGSGDRLCVPWRQPLQVTTHRSLEKSYRRETLCEQEIVREREMHAEGVRVLFHVVALVRLRLSVCGRASLGGKGARDAGSETMCPPSFPSRRKHLISSQSEGMKPGKRGREGRVAEESERGLDRLRMRV